MGQTGASMTRTLLFIASLLASLPGFAATMYISDELRVPLRSSPCSTCAIVHRGLIAGTRLEVLQRDGEWTRVRTGSNLEGWLPGQYLVSEPIAKLKLNDVEASNAELSEENDDLETQLTELQQQYAALENDHQQVLDARKALEVELSTIKKISGNALALQEQNEELIRRNRILQSEIDVLTASRDQLMSDNTRSWFLYGALAVFFGAILAAILPRLKPRRRYSEWA